MDTIAVITPCFNSSKFILDCIQSVSKANTFGKFEIHHIVIDDGSTDTTWEILQQQSVSNLTILHLDENKGPSYARNFAIQKTQGEYIFCLDSDDVLFQNSLYSLYTRAKEKNSSWVYGDMIRSNENLQYLVGNDYYGWNFKTIEEVLTALYTNKHFFQHNCFFTKSAFEKAGGYDESVHMGEDFDLYTRMLLAGFMPHYLPGPLYIHRFHEQNASKEYTKHPEKNEEVIRQLYKKYEGKLKNFL